VTAGGTTHGFDHFLTELHRRRQRFRILAKDITKVNVEQMAYERGSKKKNV
jgi:hypothetical protein